MKDFTIEAYKEYLKAIQKSFSSIITFKEYFENKDNLIEFCIQRHDVDRKPKNALRIAKIEHEMGLRATYYFRMKRSSYDKSIIEDILNMGHEIGYHYECLSDTNGDYKKAYNEFEHNLRKFRKISDIKTISMHGRPFSKFDNRDLWKTDQGKDILKRNNILGEVYLDIDYSDILYVSDTGRNWHSDRANVRDKVDSKIKIDFDSGDELLNYLSKKPHEKFIFQTHPERWSEKRFEYRVNLLKDCLINMIKRIIK
jgi:hypothetical protein